LGAPLIRDIMAMDDDDLMRMMVFDDVDDYNYRFWYFPF
jgi:hypothetical protein